MSATFELRIPKQRVDEIASAVTGMATYLMRRGYDNDGCGVKFAEALYEGSRSYTLFAADRQHLVLKMPYEWARAALRLVETIYNHGNHPVANPLRETFETLVDQLERAADASIIDRVGGIEP